MKTFNDDAIKTTTSRQKSRRYFILLIFVTAFIIRMIGINSHPINFHATGQYKTAILTRSFFLNSDAHRDDIARIPSLFFQRHKQKIDPEINEKIIYMMYRIFGKEDLLIARILSVLYWIIGGVFIYRIALLLFGGTGAVITLVFYLFFPFGINISQSIQRESLLNMFFLWGILHIVKHFRSQKGDYFYSAAIISGFTVLIKVTMLLPLLGLILFLGIHRYGLKKYLFNLRTLWFFIIFFGTGTAYYIWSLTWNEAMRGAVSAVIIPGLLISGFFWKGWVVQIGKLTGIIPFITAVFLLFTVKSREIRYLFSGLFLGYLSYALIFSYTTATHDYYQLALYSVIALMLGQAGKLMDENGNGKKIKLTLIYSVLPALVVFSLYHQYTFLKGDHKMRPYSPAFFLVGEQGSFFYNNTSAPGIWGDAFEIGELTGHGINNILLSRSYGNAVMYYGKLFGKVWPGKEDIDYMKLRGRRIPKTDEFYYKNFAPLNPKYFIITDFYSWRNQPELQKFLNTHFRLFIKKDGFIIYDLRKKVD